MRIDELLAPMSPDGGGPNGPRKPPGRIKGPWDDDDEYGYGSTFQSMISYIQREIANRLNNQSINYLSFNKEKYNRAENYYNKNHPQYMYLQNQKLPVYVEIEDVVYALVYATATKEWDPEQYIEPFNARFEDEETYNNGITASVLSIAYLNGQVGIGYPPTWRR